MSRRCLWLFFFKQKTAYDMRISDWSSDVCSSDLADVERPCRRVARQRPQRLRFKMILMIVIIFDDRDSVMAREVEKLQPPFGPKRYGGRKLVVRRNKDRADGVALAQSLHFLDIDALGVERSEEHTSELQSLMRISYAVFCLQKKKT